VFPASIAPFHVVVLPITVSDSVIMDKAQELYRALTALGFDVLLDDRDVRPGVKFKDADLIGVPLRITVGAKDLANNVVEVKMRKGSGVEKVGVGQAVSHCVGLLESEGVSVARTDQ